MAEARVALITGCGRRDGIGAATARALAAAGHTVVVSDLREDAGAVPANDGTPGWGGLPSLVEEITRSGGTASASTADVTSEGDVRRLVDEVAERYGHLDILVSNAGAAHGADRNDIADVPLSAWEHVLTVNAQGTFLLCRAVIPHMRRAGWGRIVTMSSINGYIGRPRRAVYAASKGAIIAFTKSIATDLAPHGITANSVAPGPILTSRALSTARRDAGGDDPDTLRRSVQWVPMARHGTPEEVAATVLFLTSDAAAYITGSVIGVNGGAAGSM